MRSSKIQKLLTKDMLEYEYSLLGSMQKMSEKLNISIDSIYKYMKLYNINYNKNYVGIYNCDHSFFSQENEESFYLAGFIAADGCVQNRKYSKILKIALSEKDLGHLEKIKKILNSDNPIKKYIVKPSKLIKTSHKCVELSIVSKTIYNDLLKFNIIPNKTFTYEMPEWLINHKLVHHFMRGYFDGDGSISYCGLGKNRTVRQNSFSMLGTKSFVNQYMKILVENCFLNKNKIIKIQNVYKFSFSGNNVCSDIKNFLYKDATIFLDRKYIKFAN